MPRYVYSCPDCNFRWDEFYDITDYNPHPRCPKCSKLGNREYGLAGVSTEWSHPVISTALMVHPSQIPQVHEFDKHHGLGYTQYTKHGEPIFVSREHRRKYLKAHGYFDRDGGYGDG